MTRSSRIGRIFKYLFLTLLALVSVFPFFYMIVGMTNKTIDINRGTLMFGKELFTNIKNLLTSDLGFGRALLNSALVSVIATLLAMLISSAAGYGFEIYRTKARDRLFNILLVSMMIPFAAMMIPLFQLFSKLSNTPFHFIGINTFAAVVIPTLSTAFLIFFFRQNTKSFPKEILEAARLDGLSELEIFFKIYVPTMKSSYAAAAIITFMNNWNNYMWPLIALQSPEKRTVPLVLSAMGASYTPDYGMIMTAIVIATLPTAILFFVMQKQFVAGMMGSVKG